MGDLAEIAVDPHMPARTLILVPYLNKRTLAIYKFAIGIGIIWIGSLSACDNNNSQEIPLTPDIEVAGSVLRLESGLDLLVPAAAGLEKVADGFEFVEGPVWMPGSDDQLYFSDIPANKLYSWSENSGLHTILDE
ncbi:MAG: hypothetical protein ACR2QT_12520, partial [Woeseiaceae bacterium]